MTTISISLMSRAGWVFNGNVRPLIEAFEAEHHCKVLIEEMQWDNGLETLKGFGQSRQGPVLSEIGTSWTSAMIDSGALRPFREDEVAYLGGSWSFLPSCWKTVSLTTDSRVWAIPCLSDLRFIYYWRDMLRQAGIDEETAFLTHSSFVNAVETLAQRTAPGILPLVFPTYQTRRASLHYLASWVWTAGGDFISADGKQNLMDLPETRAGIHQHLELGRCLRGPARGLDPDEVDSLFWQRKAAISLSSTPRLTGLWMKDASHRPGDLWAAPVPGVLYIGGSNLVLWNYAAPAQQQLALELIRYLTRPQTQVSLSLASGLFPARLNVLESPPFSTDRFYRSLIRSMRSGRSYPTCTAWGHIEDRLALMVRNLWAAIVADPDRDLDELIAAEVDPVSREVDGLVG